MEVRGRQQFWAYFEEKQTEKQVEDRAWEGQRNTWMDQLHGIIETTTQT